MSEVVNFEIEVPLAGVFPRSLLFQDPPGGLYQVRINGVKQVTSEKEGGKTTLRFQTVILDAGDARGMFTQIVVGTDWTKNFNREHLVNLLTGIGLPLETIQQKLKITPAYFLDKVAYIKVVPAPEGEVDEQGNRRFADKKFCMREDYETFMKLNAPAPAITQGTANVPPPARPQAAGGTTGVDLSSMFPA